MIGVHTNLLAWGELMKYVLVRVLVLRRGTAHIAGIGRTQNHRLAMVNAITRAIAEARAGCFARKFSRYEFVGRQLAVAVVLHSALGHLRSIGRRVRGGRRQIRLLAGVHFAKKNSKIHEN